MRRDHYYTAAVCRRNGHVASLAVELAADVDHSDTTPTFSTHCSDCGSKLITTCPRCESPILGYPIQAMSLGGIDYKPSAFCDACGGAYPWAATSTRYDELANRLEEENLDEATELQVREQLDALRESEADDKASAKRWETIQRIAPTFVEASKEIIVTLLSEAGRRTLWSP